MAARDRPSVLLSGQFSELGRGKRERTNQMRKPRRTRKARGQNCSTAGSDPHWDGPRAAQNSRGSLPAVSFSVCKGFGRGHTELYSTLNAEENRFGLQKGEDRSGNLESSTQTTQNHVQLRLDQEARMKLTKYAEFLDCSPSHVVTEALKLVCQKDKEFQSWLSGQNNTTTEPIKKGDSFQVELK